VRIGIDYTAAVRQGGGIGRYARSLVRGLTEVGGAHSYRLLVAGGVSKTRREEWPPNFRVISLPLSDRWTTILWQRLRLPLWADLFTGPVDVFHSPDFVLPPIRRGKRVVTVHDLSFLRCPACYESGLREYLEAAVPRSVDRADLVLADSESTRQDLVELLGVPATKVKVLYLGVEPRFCPVVDEKRLEQVRERYGLPGRFVLSLGTLQPRKNFERLIEAHSGVLERMTQDIHLVIAGRRGWLYEGIFKRVEELGLRERVTFLGFFADEDLPLLYNLADLFVLPSLYEGFGLPPLEAMACGTPVVASDVSSLPEVLGDAARMVDPLNVSALTEAMCRVLSDAHLRHRMIRKGLAQAGKFTWQDAANSLRQAYEEFMPSLAT